MEDQKGILVRTTRDEINEFKNSFLWKDMKRELGIWKRMISQRALELTGECIRGERESGSVLAALGSLYGSKETVNRLLGLPDHFIEELNIRKEEKEKNGLNETT